MTRYHGKNSAVYVNEYNLSGYANSWNTNISVDTADVTTFADTSKEHLEGDYGCDFGWTGFFDTADDGWDEILFGEIITTRGFHYSCIAINGTTAGNTVYEIPGIFSAVPHNADVGGAVALDGSVTGDEHGRGISLLDTSVTGVAAKTSQDYGVKASGLTMMVIYRIEAMDGAGDMVFALEESSDNAVGDPFAAVAALASGTLTTTGTTVKTTTGATERYLRVNVTTFDPNSATVYVTVVTMPTS